MGYIITAILFAVVILGCFAVSFLKVKETYGEGYLNFKPLRWVAAGVLVLFGITTLVMSITTVGARAVGIQTAFGKYQNTLANGLQLTAPWSSVEEFTTQVQYLDLDGDQAVPVTFEGGGGGSVNATPRWRIDAAGAENLWKKYRTFDAVRDKLVNSSAKDAVRIIASKYTPNEARSGENLRAVAEGVAAQLAADLKDDGIIIDSVSVKGISLDERSQSSLDKIVTANNDIERAKAEQQRAKIDAETAKIREQGGSLDPAALQRYCLEVVNNWDVGRNGPLPAGFTCSGGANPFVITNK